MKNKILVVDDPKENALLRKPCKKVKNPQATEIIILAQTMARICSQPGVAGIAAPQLGVNVRMFALSTGTNEPPLFFVNPKIIGYSEETSPKPEGCLSVPGRGGNVERSENVKLVWWDHNFKRYEYTFSGFYAQAVQHEMDHIDGILYIDKCDIIQTEDEMREAFKKSQEDTNKMSSEEIESEATKDMTSPLAGLERAQEPPINE